MSAEKLLSTIGGVNKNVKGLVPGSIELSELYVTNNNYRKSKELFALGHEYTKTLSNFAMGAQGHVAFTPSEIFLKNICIKIELNSGTVTLPPCWGYQIIDNIRVSIPGAQRQDLSGQANFIVTMYEANSDSKRNDLIALGGGNADVVNPANNVVAYVHLNILTSSVDEHQQMYYPCHLLNQNIDIDIRFKNATDFFKSGSTTIANAEIFYQRATVYDMGVLKSKREVYPLPYRQFRDFEFDFTGVASPNVQTIRIDGITEDGELDQILCWVNIDSDRATNKNALTGAVQNNILGRLADREVIRGDFDYHSMYQLYQHKDQLKYTLAGATQRFYNLPFTAVPYKYQQQLRNYVNGSDISQDDFKYSFSSPAVASRLYVVPVYKVLMTFHNGLMQHVK